MIASYDNALGNQNWVRVGNTMYHKYQKLKVELVPAEEPLDLDRLCRGSESLETLGGCDES